MRHLEQKPFHGFCVTVNHISKIAVHQNFTKRFELVISLIQYLYSFPNLSDMDIYVLQSGAAYFCFCSQRRLELLKKDALRRREVPKYDNRCRHLTSEEVEAKLKVDSPYVIRLKVGRHCS